MIASSGARTEQYET